jgi:hypothetical protein
MALLVDRWETGPVARWAKRSNKSWKISSQGTYLKAGRVTAKKKNSTHYFSRDVEEGEMLMMMIMSENHTMPVTGPCDSDSGYLNLCSELSTYGPSVVLTIHRSGRRGWDRIRTVNMLL